MHIPNIVFLAIPRLLPYAQSQKFIMALYSSKFPSFRILVMKAQWVSTAQLPPNLILILLKILLHLRAVSDLKVVPGKL